MAGLTVGVGSDAKQSINELNQLKAAFSSLAQFVRSDVVKAFDDVEKVLGGVQKEEQETTTTSRDLQSALEAQKTATLKLAESKKVQTAANKAVVDSQKEIIKIQKEQIIAQQQLSRATISLAKAQESLSKAKTAKQIESANNRILASQNRVDEATKRLKDSKTSLGEANKKLITSKNSLKDANSAVNQITKESVRANKELSAISKEVTKENKEQKRSTEGLTDSMIKANLAAGLIQSAVSSIGNAFKDALRSTIEFNKTFANVTTLVDTAVVDTQKMQQELLGLDNRLGSATKLTEGLYQSLSAGVDAAKAVEFVGEAAKFSIAGLTDTETAVDSLTTVLNAYGMASEEVTRVSDVFFQTVKLGKISGEELASTLGAVVPLSSNLGVSVEELGAIMAVFTKQGINAANATARINAVMTSFLKPSEAMTSALKKLGFESGSVAIKDLGGLRNAVKAITDVTGLTQEQLQGFQKELENISSEAKNSEEETLMMDEAFEKLKNSAGASKDEIAALFPNVRALQGVLALTGEGAKDFEAVFNSMDFALGSVDESLDKQRTTFAAMQNSLGKTAIAIGNILVPALEFGAKVIERLSDGFRTFLEGNALARAITIFGGIATAVGIVIVAMGGFAAATSGVTTAIVAMTAVAAANPILLLATALTAVVTISAAFIVNAMDINTINKKLVDSTNNLANAQDEHAKITAKLNRESEELSRIQEHNLNLQRRQLQIGMVSEIEKIAKQYTKLNKERFLGNSRLENEQKRLDEVNKEMNKLLTLTEANKDADGRAINKFLDVRDELGKRTVKLSIVEKKIRDLRAEGLKIEEKLAGSTIANLEGVEQTAKALIDQSVLEKDLLSIKETFPKFYEEVMKRQKELLAEMESQTKEQTTQEEVLKKQEETSKKINKITKERSDFLADLTKRLEEQNKTELELLTIRANKEMKEMERLFRGHKDYEKIKAQVTTFYENEKLNIIRKTNEGVSNEYGKTAKEIESFYQRELDLLIRNGADREKATANIESKILQEKINANVIAESKMKELLDNFVKLREKADGKDFENYNEFVSLKNEADKNFRDHNIKQYADYLLRIGEITKEQYKEIIGEQEKAAKTAEEAFSETSSILSSVFSSASTGIRDDLDGIAGDIGKVSKVVLDSFSTAFDKLADKSATLGDKIAAGVTAGLQVAGAALEMVFDSINGDLSSQLASLESQYEKDLEQFSEKEEDKIAIAQENLTRQQELINGMKEAEQTQRELELEEYAAHIQGLTDEDIDRALELKEQQLREMKDSKKLKELENLAKAKDALDEAKREKKLAEEKTAIENKFEKEKNEIQRKAFETEKAGAIAKVWIQAGIGIISAWASSMQLGPIAGPIVASVLTTAMLGIAAGQTAAIATKQMPAFADGVTNFGGGTALVGERGPEMVTLGRGANVITNENTARVARAFEQNSTDNAGSMIIQNDIYLDSELIEQQTIERRRYAGNRIGVV
ncbi:MAG: phage tail tape measure protein [Mycoplasma sp.]|nr:phage tail tape measure protein [Mycoplasma sp.]